MSPHGAGGVYLWNDEGAARAFMNERVAPMIRERFHVEPTIEIYDSPVIVDNCLPQGGGRRTEDPTGNHAPADPPRT